PGPMSPAAKPHEAATKPHEAGTKPYDPATGPIRPLPSPIRPLPSPTTATTLSSKGEDGPYLLVDRERSSENRGGGLGGRLEDRDPTRNLDGAHLFEAHEAETGDPGGGGQCVSRCPRLLNRGGQRTHPHTRGVAQREGDAVQQVGS